MMSDALPDNFFRSDLRTGYGAEAKAWFLSSHLEESHLELKSISGEHVE